MSDMGQEMRNKKSPLTSLTGSGRASFYACFFTLCQAGMPNVLEEKQASIHQLISVFSKHLNFTYLTSHNSLFRLLSHHK